jgi:hypothetical protein
MSAKNCNIAQKSAEVFEKKGYFGNKSKRLKA